MQKRPKPLSHVELRYLDIDIKRRQLAKVKERAKKRRRRRAFALILLLGSFLLGLSFQTGRLKGLSPSLKAISLNAISTQATLLWQNLSSMALFKNTQPENSEIVAISQASPSSSLAAPLLSKQSLVLREVKVVLQVGHLDADKHPDELAKLRISTGGEGYGLSEVRVNQEVAKIVQRQLERYGITVEIIPATVPLNLEADLFISLHADSTTDPRRRGYKSAHFQVTRNEKDALFKEIMDEVYLKASGLPDDSANISGDMNFYYAFNTQRYLHSLARDIPAIIMEMGYLSNSQDVVFLKDTKRPASAISEGILSFLYQQNLLSHLPYPMPYLTASSILEANSQASP
ncbi:MAG: N-acetylmuramoyl-L-alanine amidase [Deinococcales bacterium]